MSVTYPSPDDLAGRDILARIDRNQAEIGKLLAEQSKFVAEQSKLLAEQTKLNAEQIKLHAEADKLRRDRFLAPVATAAAIGAVVAALAPAVFRALAAH